MWGGPSHLDTFDPKPDAGRDYCGPLDKPIATNVDGIRIGELLPLLAKQADKYSIIRSMTHGNNGHETAAYIVQTGRQPRPPVVPELGRRRLAVQGLRPRLQGADPALRRSDRPAGALLRGRLPRPALQAVRHRRRSGASRASPSRAWSPQGITDERQKRRRELLHRLDTLGRAMPAEPAVPRSRQVRGEGLRADPRRCAASCSTCRRKTTSCATATAATPSASRA